MILFVGTTIALALNDTTGLIGTLGKSLGLAFVVTGCISVFREGVISRGEFEETKALFDEVKTLLKSHFHEVCEGLLKEKIYLLSEDKKGHPSFHKWLLQTKPQRIFFAGHSVLHSVQRDFIKMRFKSVEENIENKLLEGSEINIIFLDPTWGLLKDMAEGEGQSLKDFCLDIKKTLEICQDIWKRIEGKSLPGEINIYTCRETVQYAYHNVVCPDDNESEMLIGFYFAGILGTKSPLFRVEGDAIQQFFKRHFRTISREKTTRRLLAYSHNGTECTFDLPYYEVCLQKVNKVISGNDEGD